MPLQSITLYMGHPLRDRDPSIYRLMTIRTVRGEMWLRPDKHNRRLIGGIIARYQEILGIKIYAYAVLSNHIHLLIKAPKGNADEFAENIHREISRRINWRYRREGSLWARRYSEQEVLREEDLVEALLYIATNCTHHGLLQDASQWKGLNCYKHILSESDRMFSFTHHSKRCHDGVPVKTSHKLKLSILPQFEELSVNKRRTKMKQLLSDRLEQLWEKRGGKQYLEQQTIDEQQPGEIPHNMSRSPRPICYTKCGVAFREFLLRKRELLKRYTEASIRFRLGDLTVLFPKYTFKPPLHREPRRRTFVSYLHPHKAVSSA